MNRGKVIISAALLIFIGIALRAVFVIAARPVDGDMAVVGLMARHIAEGRDFPVYIPMLHYGGAFSAYIGAGLFKLFGSSSLTYAFTGVILSSLWMALVFVIARKACDGFGALSALAFAAIPPFSLFEHSMITALSAEGLFSISLVLFILLRWASSTGSKGWAISFLLGFSSGFALWMTPAASPLLATVAVVILLSGRKNLFSVSTLHVALGFLTGYMPALIYNLQYPLATFFRMAGKVLELDRSVLSAADMKVVIAGRILWKLSTIPSSLFKVPVLTAHLIGTLNAVIFFISFIWVTARSFIRALSKDGPAGGWGILILYTLASILFYSVMVGLAAPRYMLPLCVVVPLFIAQSLSYLAARSRFLAVLAAALILLYNVCGTGYSFSDTASSRYIALADWLETKGLRTGFSDYYTAYITQFESGEEVIISPTLYHLTFCDRWPSETARVRGSKALFYVVDTGRHPKAKDGFEGELRKRGISYKSERIEDFMVYYDLSAKIYPEELALEAYSGPGK